MGSEDSSTGSALLSKPGDRRALGVMTVAHGVQHFYVAGLAVAYPFVIADLHVSYAVLGAVLTVAGILGGLLQGAAGLLRRTSAKAVLALQNLGLAAATFGGAFSGGFALFSLARVAGALVSWPQHPVGSAYLSDRFPHRRATVLSWHTAGGSAGTVAMPLVVSVLISTAGWRYALVALGGCLALGSVLVWVGLPREHRPVERASVSGGLPDAGSVAGGNVAGGSVAGGSVAGASVAGASGKNPGQSLRLREVLTRRRVAAVLAASTIAAGGRGLGTLTVYIPAYLRSGLGLSALGVGELFSVVMAASIAGPLLVGNLADRLGRTQTLVVTYLVAAVAIAAFGATGRHFVALAILGAAVGLLAYAESPLVQALFSELTADVPSRVAFGAFFSIAYGVGALWTAIIGIIISYVGFTAAFATMAGSFVVAAIVLLAWARE